MTACRRKSKSCCSAFDKAIHPTKSAFCNLADIYCITETYFDSLGRPSVKVANGIVKVNIVVCNFVRPSVKVNIAIYNSVRPFVGVNIGICNFVRLSVKVNIAIYNFVSGSSKL